MELVERGLTMMMSESEICTSYRDAKSKSSQIEVLAELNATTTDNIKEILKKHGMLVGKRGPKPKAMLIEAADPLPGETGYKERKVAVVNEDFEAAVHEMQGKREPLPDVIKESIQLGIEVLDQKIAIKEQEIYDAKGILEELKEKRRSITEYMKRSI